MHFCRRLSLELAILVQLTGGRLVGVIFSNKAIENPTYAEKWFAENDSFNTIKFSKKTIKHS